MEGSSREGRNYQSIKLQRLKKNKNKKKKKQEKKKIMPFENICGQNWCEQFPIFPCFDSRRG